MAIHRNPDGGHFTPEWAHKVADVADKDMDAVEAGLKESQRPGAPAYEMAWDAFDLLFCSCYHADPTGMVVLRDNVDFYLWNVRKCIAELREDPTVERLNKVAAAHETARAVVAAHLVELALLKIPRKEPEDGDESLSDWLQRLAEADDARIERERRAKEN